MINNSTLKHLFNEYKKQAYAEIESAKFSKKGEKCLSDLVIPSIPKVRRYCTEKLAQIFSECISWIEEYPRDKTDWFFAEECINSLDNVEIKEFAEKTIILGACDILPEEIYRKISYIPKENNTQSDLLSFKDKTEEEHYLNFLENCLWEISCNTKKPRENTFLQNNGGNLVWLLYKKYMKKLPDDELIFYLQKGKENLSENLDIFLGRSIFQIYQKCNRLPKGYGQKNFD